MPKGLLGSVSLFAYWDVGKGREQDAEGFRKKNQLSTGENL